MEFRKQITGRFDNIFKPNKGGGAESNYGWFSILDTLAGGNVLNIDKVAAIELNLCLMKLSLDTDRAVEKNLEAKKKEAKRLEDDNIQHDYTILFGNK